MRIFLTGVTGFVGSHLLAKFQAAGHQVRALVRPSSMRKMSAPAGVELVQGDVVENLGLASGMDSADAVIHLVGIIMEADGATFERVHHQGTTNVLAAAKRAGVKRFVQMSALGARADGVSGYQTSKWKAEEAVRHSGMEHVILRPSIIYGPRDGFVTQMVQVMRSAPLFRPVVGHGQYRFRPIYVEDVTECFLQSLASDLAVNRTIDLVGPEELTLDQILAAIAECVGIRKPPVHLPFQLMYLNAAILGILLRRPPVTTDQLRMLREGSTADPAPMLRIFKLNPGSFRDGLNKYLCRTVAN